MTLIEIIGKQAVTIEKQDEEIRQLRSQVEQLERKMKHDTSDKTSGDVASTSPTEPGGPLPTPEVPPLQAEAGGSGA